jgi:hypothetical protein
VGEQNFYHFAIGEIGARGWLFMFILCRAAKNEPRKRAKGPNALWKPATRKRRFVVTPLIFARNVTNSAFALAF